MALVEYRESDPFPGSIGVTSRESSPAWPGPRRAPDGAPNVRVVVLDDVGFAQLGCYGSDIDTPNIDALAAGGLQFTNFHVTPLCSPTRAALLTGRSNHAVGMRHIANVRGYGAATYAASADDPGSCGGCGTIVLCCTCTTLCW